MDWIFTPALTKKKTQSTDGLKIVCWWNKNFVPLTWIHKCAQSTDGLTVHWWVEFLPLPWQTKTVLRWIKICLLLELKFSLLRSTKSHEQSTDRLNTALIKIICTLCNDGLKFYTCPDFNQMHTLIFHCRIQKCSPVQLKITGKQMDADISPTLANNHMHTVQTRTKTFLSTISPLTNLV